MLQFHQSRDRKGAVLPYRSLTVAAPIGTPMPVAIRLSHLLVYKGVGITPSPPIGHEYHGRMSIRQNVFMRKILRRLAPYCFALMASTLAVSFAPQLYSQEQDGIFTTQISPNLSIVREINPANPYAGQQFSIIYSLYAFQFPVAVDIEPQQYSHFWTEIIPLTEQTRTITRIIHGRARHEFLLRQVVAYPLSTGILELPPLALKVKMTGNLAAGSENWDLIAQSKADFIRVRPLPPHQESTTGVPFTGSMSGQWSEVPTG